MSSISLTPIRFSPLKCMRPPQNQVRCLSFSFFVFRFYLHEQQCVACDERQSRPPLERVLGAQPTIEYFTFCKLKIRSSLAQLFVRKFHAKRKFSTKLKSLQSKAERSAVAAMANESKS